MLKLVVITDKGDLVTGDVDTLTTLLVGARVGWGDNPIAIYGLMGDKQELTKLVWETMPFDRDENNHLLATVNIKVDKQSTLILATGFYVVDD